MLTLADIVFLLVNVFVIAFYLIKMSVDSSKSIDNAKPEKGDPSKYVTDTRLSFRYTRPKSTFVLHFPKIQDAYRWHNSCTCALLFPGVRRNWGALECTWARRHWFHSLFCGFQFQEDRLFCASPVFLSSVLSNTILGWAWCAFGSLSLTD